ncbi:MAG: helix-turn-helix domain-containing protein [Candidatus Symbiodolus clandestinus]
MKCTYKYRCYPTTEQAEL